MGRFCLFGYEVFVEVDLIIIWVRWGNMVSCFLREDLGEVGIFQQEGDFRFCLLSGNNKFHCCCEFCNEWRVWKEPFAIALKDPVDLLIVQGMLEVLLLCVVIKVVVEMRVVDSVYVHMSMGLWKGLSEEGVMPLGISGMGRV